MGAPARRSEIHADLEYALGAFNSKNAQEGHIRFPKDMAVLILERPWCKKQITDMNADGTAMELNVSSSPEPEMTRFRAT